MRSPASRAPADGPSSSTRRTITRAPVSSASSGDSGPTAMPKNGRGSEVLIALVRRLSVALRGDRMPSSEDWPSPAAIAIESSAVPAGRSSPACVVRTANAMTAERAMNARAMRTLVVQFLQGSTSCWILLADYNVDRRHLVSTTTRNRRLRNQMSRMEGTSLDTTPRTSLTPRPCWSIASDDLKLLLDDASVVLNAEGVHLRASVVLKRYDDVADVQPTTLHGHPDVRLR